MSDREKLFKDGETFFYQDVFYEGDLAAAGTDTVSKPFAFSGVLRKVKFVAQLIGNGGIANSGSDAVTVKLENSNTVDGKYTTCIAATVTAGTATATTGDARGLYPVVSGTFIDYIDPAPAKYGKITITGDNTAKGLTLKVGFALA